MQRLREGEDVEGRRIGRGVAGAAGVAHDGGELAHPGREAVRRVGV